MNSGIDYTLDLESGLTQVLDDGKYGKYLYGTSRLAQDSGGGMEYYLTDALGSVRQVVDENGAILLSEGYRPYGEVLDQAGTGASVFGFAGEARDSTGLSYLRARYYEPGTGRFTQIDPSRLESVGHGESKPIASNRTARGRAANRRVEFKILSE